MRLFKKFKSLGIIIVIFTLTLILSSCENSLQINGITVNTTINKDGSVKMDEKISFHYSDGKEPITKNIFFPDGSEVKDLVVSDNKGDIYKQVTSYSEGEVSKVYTKTSVDKNLVALEIYSPDEVEDETYDVTYTLANIATKYSDSAQFVWTYVGRSTDVSIGDVAVNINFEEKIDKDAIKVDLNGPLTKTVQVDDSGIKTYVNSFPTDTLYEVSVLFPNNYIENSSKISNDTIKDKVEKIEGQWKDYDNARITNKKIHNNLMIGIFLVSLLFILYFYMRFCRKKARVESFKLYKELPRETSPAVMRKFLSGRIRALDVVATAFDLVRRGHLIYLQDDYVFQGGQPFGGKGISHETFFMKFFLNTIGKKRKLIIREIEINKIDANESTKIQQDYDTWKNKVSSDKDKEFKFKDYSFKPLIIGSIFSITIILTTIISSLILNKFSALIFINIIVAIYIMYFAIIKRKKSIQEEVMRNRCACFKEFLKDKDSLLEELNKDISLAEKYLPYAISLGVHREFIDILKNNIQSKDILGFEKLTYLKLDNEYHFQGVSEVIDIIEKYLNDAFVPKK